MDKLAKTLENALPYIYYYDTHKILDTTSPSIYLLSHNMIYEMSEIVR